MAHLITLREDAETVNAIAVKTAETLLEAYDVDVVKGQYALPTLAYSFFAGIINRLNQFKTPDAPVHFNFGDLFTVGITYQEEEDAEKEGNFTPFINAGAKFEGYVKGEINNLTMPFAGDTMDFGANQETVNAISDFTQKYLKREHDIPMDGQVLTISAIAYTFFATLIEELTAAKQDDSSVEINFAQLFDIGVQGEENVFTPYFRAGQAFKLMIKDDNVTE